MKATTGQVRRRSRWRSLRARVILLAACLAGSELAGATDFYWTNTTAGGDFTNAANWFTNGVLSTTVPGATDNANFTNLPSYTVNWTSSVTNNNAFFNSAANSTVTLNVGAGNVWWLDNSFIVGQNANTTATVSHTSGTIVVTNASGLGTLVVGQSGAGTYALAGGTLTVNRLSATNNSILSFQNGTLTTLDGSALSVPGALAIGTGGGTLNWNMLGGTNETVATGNINLGAASGSRAVVLVSGPGTLWSNAAPLLVLGSVNGAHQNELVISNQARVISGDATLGANLVTSTNNRVIVTGPNSVWDAGNIIVGHRSSHQNQILITNGGLVRAASVTLGYISPSFEEKVIVTDSGSRLLINGGLTVGNNGLTNSLTVANGGVVSNGLAAYIGAGINRKMNSALVTGAGSLWTSAGILYVGYQGAQSSLVISNGGSVATLSDAWIGGTADGSNNTVLVTGPGSRLDVGTDLYVGTYSLGNTMLISNSAKVTARSMYVGNTTGTNLLQIVDGGLLEANTLVAGNFVSNRIQNTGGIYQFSTNTPVITPNTAGAISLSNGTLSFRGITNANVFGNWTGSQLTNMSFQGANGFRLNNASNAIGVASYTFATGLGPTNYARLELQNGGHWRSTTLQIGSGGSLIGDGTVESTSVTNLGTIAPGFSAGQLTFTSNLVLGATSKLEMEIGGNNPADYDRLIVNGSVTVTGTLAVASINGFDTTPGEIYTLIDNLGSGSIIGQFDGLTNNAFIDASANGGDAYFRILYDGGTGNDLVLLATVPEPSALAFFAVAACAFLRRRPEQIRNPKLEIRNKSE